MALAERVSANGGVRAGGSVVRRVIAATSLFVLMAACVAVAITLKRSQIPQALLSSSENVGGDLVMHKKLVSGQALAFGDVDGFKTAKNSQAREGSVRGGVKPDFHAPLGDLGKVGLAKKIKDAPAQALAFGDADGFKIAKDAHKREGSVRAGVKPDFHAPLGDLGKVGLVKGHKASPSQSLAFGDSEFHAGSVKADKEGSVRGNVTPDFKPPLGTLGETGLAAAKKRGEERETGNEKLSAVAAREALDFFYSQQDKTILAKSGEVAQAKMSAPSANADLLSFFSSQVTKSAKEHQTELAKDMADEKASTSDVSTYFDSLQNKDAKMHEAAMKRQAAEALAMAKLEAEQNEEVAAAHQGSKHPVAAADSASTQKLADSEGSIFTKHSGNKHGFHPPHLSRLGGRTNKELKAARDIEKRDLDDCAFTLC